MGAILKDIDDLINELEKEVINSHEEDQFGYAKQDAWDVYKKVIIRLKTLKEHHKEK